jgi:hypothetical protein
VAAENRLTAEQLADLAPGDVVTIESAADFGKPRHSMGTVVRIEARHIVVSWRSARGVPYLHRYGRRDGVRVGGGHRAELVHQEATDSAPAEQRRRLLRIDALYREWARDRGDVDRLRRLHEAISDCLQLHSADAT